MKKMLYWKKFSESGNVFDYLEYKKIERRKKEVIKQNRKRIEM